jgi:hypothetical protein
MKTDDRAATIPFFKKRWVQICGAFMLLALLLVLLAPLGGRYYLAYWLEKNGADSASVEKLRFNPFLGKLTLGGVDVQIDGKTILKNSDMVIDLGIASLFDKDVRVEKAMYQGLMIDLQQYPDGRWRIGSYTLDQSDSSVEEVSTVEGVSTVEDVVSSWAFLADTIQLKDGIVHLKTPDLEMSLMVEEAELSRFTTRHGAPSASFRLKGALEDEPLEIQLDILHVIEDLQLGGDVEISRFALEELAPLLADVLPTFSGDAGLQGKVLFTMKKQGDILVDFEGTVELGSPNIGSESFTTAAEQLKWQGKVHYQMAPETPITVDTDGILSGVHCSFSLADDRLSTREAAVTLTGQTSVQIGDTVVVENDGSLDIDGTELKMPGLAITEQRLRWQGKTLYDSDHQGSGHHLATEGALALGPFAYQGGAEESAISTGLDALDWKGSVTYGQQQAGGESLVKTDGLLLASNYFFFLADDKLSTREAAVTLEGQTSVQLGDTIVVENDGSLDIDGAELKMPGLAITEQRLQWQGKTLYDANHQGSGQHLATEGALALGPFAYRGGAEESAISTGLDALDWKGSVTYGQLQAGGESLVKTDGLLLASNYFFSLADDKLSTREAAVTLEGQTSVQLGDTIVVENDGSLDINGAELKMPGLAITEQRLRWQGKTLYDANHQGSGQHLATEGALALGPFAYRGGAEGSAISAGLDTLGWKGSLIYGQQVGGRDSLVEIDGKLTAGMISAALEQLAMEFSQEKFQLSSKSALRIGEAVDLSGQTSFTLDNFTMTQDKANKPTLTLGNLEVAELNGLGGKNIALKKMLASDLAAVVPGPMPLDVDVAKIALTDFSTSDLARFTIDDLRLESPHAVSLHSGKELLHMDGLDMSTVTLSRDGSGSVESVRLDNFILLGVKEGGKEKAGARLGKGLLETLSWSADGDFSGGKLRFEDLVTTVIREKEGTLNLPRRLAEMKVDDPGAAAEKKDKGGEGQAEPAAGKNSKMARIKLGGLEVTGDSRVKFEDYTLVVPYITDLAIKEFKVSALDSASPGEITEVNLIGTLEQRAPLEVSGHLAPLKEQPTVKMKINLKNYPLSSLSAYTVQAVGIALASGQLAIKSQLALNDGVVDMENDVLLKKLQTKTISKELAADLDNQLPLPLDSALSTLRDKDGNIELNIPLQGPISELDVGISDVIITALSKAIVPAASGYLMYALGPYGALAYVGMKVGEKMLQVDLPPVQFELTETTVTDEHKKYLERVAGILTDKPETDIQICPQVVSWEFMSEQDREKNGAKEIEVNEKDREDLIALGQQRAEAVKQYLLRQHNIDEGRLLICDTQIAAEKDALPVVFLHL